MTVSPIRRSAELHVWLEGVPGQVGSLTRDGMGGSPRFTYETDYLRLPSAVPLSAALPLQAEPYNEAPTLAFFDNLLPEGARRREEALVRRIDPSDVVGLLSVLGRECPGAVSILPAGEPAVKMPGDLDADYDALSDDQLAGLIEAVATGRAIGERTRFSLAGVQQKLAVARDPASGRFLLPRGGAPTTWLIKVEPRGGDYRGIVANEALCLAVLHRLGLRTVVAQRSSIGGYPVLLIPRYDRSIDSNRQVHRLHQEDAAQILGLLRELKYEVDAELAGIPADRRGYTGLLGRFAEVTRGHGGARLTLLKAAHANWLLGNCDAHAKNFAIRHGRAVAGQLKAGHHVGFGFDLAPLYDVVCVAAYPMVDQSLAMHLGRAKLWDEVEREDWLVLARQMFPGRNIAAGILARQLDWLRTMAESMLPVIDAIVEDGVVTRQEAKPIRDVVGSRVRHLNRTLGWTIPADTDAPIRRGGGWSLS